MARRLYILLSLGVFFLLAFQNTSNIEPSDNLADTLYQLGMEKPTHFLENYTPEMIKRGQELIHKGKVTAPPSGFNSNSISKYYQCTTCHNVVRESDLLTENNPEERLKYAEMNKLPYLQGSTFWGIVNRESWYNDDYVLKYGSLVDKAKSSLEESTQLCAQVCSQGRPLVDWEMESILAYFWSLQMKIEDLAISKEEVEEINSSSSEKAIEILKSKYLAKSPATFGHLPESKQDGYPFTGRPELGKVIYENGCQHCHRVGGESDVLLDNYKSTFKWLKKNITSDSELSIYEIIRKGTYSQLGHKEYMPHYTEEKMSDQQLEDLRSYIELRAKR